MTPCFVSYCNACLTAFVSWVFLPKHSIPAFLDFHFLPSWGQIILRCTDGPFTCAFYRWTLRLLPRSGRCGQSCGQRGWADVSGVCFRFFWIHSEVALLGHMVCSSLTLLSNLVLLSRVAVPRSVPTSRARGCESLPVPAVSCSGLAAAVTLLGVRCCLTVVLICMFLIIHHVEDLFMCWLAIYISSLEKRLFKSFAHLEIGLLFFRCCWVWGVLYIFWTLIPYQIYYLQIFSMFLWFGFLLGR